MKIIIYDNSERNENKLMFNKIYKSLPAGKTVVARSIATLRKEVACPFHEHHIAILIINTIDELRELAGDDDVLNIQAILIILDEETPEKLSLAHRLHPRFIALMHDDPAEVLMVIENMMKRVTEQERNFSTL